MAEEHPIQGDLFGELDNAKDRKRKRKALAARMSYPQRKTEREARMASGLCGYCAKPAVLGKKRCQECADKQNAKLRIRRIGSYREKELAAIKEKYEKRKTSGLCITCGEPVHEGRVLCLVHLEKHNLAGAERKRRHRAAGKCACGKEKLPRRSRCEACQEQRNARHHTTVKERRDKGLCQYCGESPPIEGRLGCAVCVQVRTEMSYNRYRDRLEQGLCVTCGKVAPIESARVCIDCFFKRASGWLFHNYEHAQELRNLLEKQNYRCVYSNRQLMPGVNAEIDHIVAESNGGKTEIDNLQWVHVMANQMKFNYSEEDFLRMVEAIYKHRIAH